MSQEEQKVTQDFQAQAENSASQGNWETAAKFYAQRVEQYASELALINSVQEGLSSTI